MDFSTSIVYPKKRGHITPLISLDTIKGTMPTDYISSINKNKFKMKPETMTTKEGKEILIGSKLQMINNPIGLKYLIINEYQSKVHFQMSAKILNENYKQGISNNTIDQLLKVLKDSGIGLHYDFMKETNLSAVHEKNDLLVDFDRLQTELIHIPASGFIKTIEDNSVSFRKNLKTYQQLTRFYGKLDEIMNNIKIYKALNIDIDEFLKIARMETKSDNPATVKRNYQTRNMEYILNNNGINYSVCMELFKGQPKEVHELDLSNVTISEFKDLCMFKYLFDINKGNIGLMKKGLRNMLSKTTKTAPYYKKLNEIYPILANPQGRTFECLEAVKNGLRPR